MAIISETENKDNPLPLFCYLYGYGVREVGGLIFYGVNIEDRCSSGVYLKPDSFTLIILTFSIVTMYYR